MATFTRPTFTQILDRVQADINTRLPGTDARLRRSILNVISYIQAGLAHGLYGYISYTALQVFPDTAEAEFLNRWGAIWGVSRTAAAFASGTVDFTGTAGTIPIGTKLQRADLALFTTTTSATISAGIASATVLADVAGVAGNTAVTTALTFVSPIAGVTSTALVATGGLINGTDTQDDTAYLQAVLNRIQNPAQGGSASDYETWTFAASVNVTRVWVYPLESGAGTVTVRFMMDDLYSDGIPLTADVTAVQAYIDSVRPVTAAVTVAAPIATPLNFTIHLVQNDTADIRTAVHASLVDMLRRDAEPAGTLNLSRIVEAINLTDGVYGCVLSVPNADVTATAGHISVMGTITWV